MNFRSGEADWIYAAKLGEQLRSDHVHRSIHRHDSEGRFSWSLSAASGGDKLNPFLTEAAVTSHGGSQSGTSTQEAVTAVSDRRDMLIHVHGAVAAVVFVFLFPIGGILIRLANFRGGMAMHVGIQIVAWLVALAALGLGIYLAVGMNLLKTARAHPILGIVLLVLILGQPLYGWLHHRAFKAHGRRTIWSWAHLSVGRIAIFGGMVNTGLGLQLARHTGRKYLVPFGIACGVVALLYLGAIVYGLTRLRKVQPNSRSFAKIGSEEKTGARGFNRLGEQGLSVPMTQRPFRLRRDDVLHDADSTEYVPLAGREGYADEAGSRAGSRAASPAPMPLRLSSEPPSRAASQSRPIGDTAYDP